MMNGRIRVADKPTQAFLAWSQEKDIPTNNETATVKTQIDDE
jgi:hypothetical protein